MLSYDLPSSTRLIFPLKGDLAMLSVTCFFMPPIIGSIWLNLDALLPNITKELIKSNGNFSNHQNEKTKNPRIFNGIFHSNS